MTSEEMERIIEAILNNRARSQKRSNRIDELLKRNRKLLGRNRASLKRLKMAVRRSNEVAERLRNPPAEQM
jgi:hypothetical protein